MPFSATAVLFRRASSAAVGLFLLGACGSLEIPPGSTLPRIAYPAPSTSAPGTTPVPESGSVVVRGGDSLYGISNRYGVPVRDLIDTNNLTPPYRLTAGQRIFLPRPRQYTVRRGDTLYGISRDFGTNLYQLARLNGIEPPYRIYSGQILRLPSSAPAPVREASRAPAPVTAAPAPTPSAKPPERAASAPPAPRETRVRTDVAGFIWPVQGRVISGFGPKSDGLHNDGINIAAPPGTPVHAVEAGTVAYAGNELRGFGNLLLVKHANGWVTAYAHNQALLVKRGDKVAKGQVIARVGNTGSVSSAQLHFELRRGNKAVDPIDHLNPPRAAMGSGPV